MGTAISEPKSPLIGSKRLPGLLFNLFLAIQNMVLGAVGLLAAAHLLLPDRPLFLAMVTMMTRYLYLPAYPLLVTGLLTKKRGVWVAATFVALLHLIWIAPDYTPARRVAAANPSLRILSVNLYYYNLQIEDLIAEIKAVDADVIFLQEAFRSWWQALEDNDMFTLYPYQVDAPWDSTAILSRWPLTDKIEASFKAATILVEGQPIRLINVHAPYLFNDAGTEAIDAYYERLHEQLALEQGPLVVAGDLNVSQYSGWYRSLTRIGLQSCHQLTGRGYVTTWPNGKMRVPAIRLDHALFSSELVCLSIREGEGLGTDHKPLIFDLALLPDENQ